MPRLTRITFFGIQLATYALFVYWATIFVGTHLPREIAEEEMARLEAFNLGDKSLHFIAYFGLGFLLCWALPARFKLSQRLVIAIAIGIAYAAFDEWSQRFVEGRVPGLDDFIADSGGFLAGVLLFIVIRQAWAWLKLPGGEYQSVA
jgi:VanZ family protein